MIHMIHACFGSTAQVNIVDAPDTLPHVLKKQWYIPTSCPCRLFIKIFFAKLISVLTKIY